MSDVGVTGVVVGRKPPPPSGGGGEPAPAPSGATGIRNVKDFGAAGDGAADDTAAIQAAIDWTADADRGTIYVPVGQYKTTRPLMLNNAGEGKTPLYIRLMGDGYGSFLAANFDGYMIERTNGDGEPGGIVIDGLMLQNNHANGSGIRLINSAVARIQNVLVRAGGVCIAAVDGMYSVNITGCDIAGNNPQKTIGILLKANQGLVTGCDIVSCLNGIRAWASATITGCRFEVNVVGAMIGMDEAGDAYATGGVQLLSSSFEANDTGIFCYACNIALIAAVSIQGTNGTPAPQPGGGQGDAHYGIRMRSMQDTTFVSVSTASAFAVGGIVYDEGAAPLRVSFTNVDPTNTNASAPCWSIHPNYAAGVEWHNCAGLTDAQQEIVFSERPAWAPLGAQRFISNANTATPGAEITTSGASHVIAVKGRANKWFVASPS